MALTLRPMRLRAEMARRGFAPGQMLPYDDPERGWADPLDDAESRADVRRFMAELWRAALAAEAVSCLSDVQTDVAVRWWCNFHRQTVEGGPCCGEAVPARASHEEGEGGGTDG